MNDLLPSRAHHRTTSTPVLMDHYNKDERAQELQKTLNPCPGCGAAPGIGHQGIMRWHTQCLPKCRGGCEKYFTKQYEHPEQAAKAWNAGQFEEDWYNEP